MTTIDDLTWTGQLPSRTPETSPFWDACNDDIFLLQKCNTCGLFQYYYRAHCSHCQSEDIVDYPSEGKGTVWTYSTVHRSGDKRFADRLPYAVGVIELEGNIKVFGNILGIDPRLVTIGLPVTIAFAEAESKQKIPVFMAVVHDH